MANSNKEEGKESMSIDDKFNPVLPEISPSQKPRTLMKKHSSKGNLLTISPAFRRSRNPLKSIKGDLYQSSSDDSSSINSEDMEWRLGDYIDTGSIGAVYRALDWDTAKLITVKFLDTKGLPEKQKLEFLERLKEEVIRIKRMNDPNIVRYINVWEGEDEEGMLAISMEYVPGGSITYLLKFFKSFKEPLVKIYLNQVVKAIQRLHQKGIVHRDVKWTNLMVDDLGTVKLSDFGFIKSLYKEYCPEKCHNLDDAIIHKNSDGLIRSINEKSKLENLIMGNVEEEKTLEPLVNSMFYCPPEVRLKQWTSLHTSYDIWSLGWICYEMLTGEVLVYDPTNPDSIQVPESWSLFWKDFLAKWLQYEPENRATIDELAEHKFLNIEESTYAESHETINFMSLFSWVAMNENPEPKKITESVERLSILQKRNKYQERDSMLNSYKIMPELSKALGIESREEEIVNSKKASLRHINLGKFNGFSHLIFSFLNELL